MGGKKCYAIMATPPPSLAKPHEDNPKLHPLCSSPSLSGQSSCDPHSLLLTSHRKRMTKTLSLSRRLNHCFLLSFVVVILVQLISYCIYPRDRSPDVPVLSSRSRMGKISMTEAPNLDPSLVHTYRTSGGHGQRFVHLSD